MPIAAPDPFDDDHDDEVHEIHLTPPPTPPSGPFLSPLLPEWPDVIAQVRRRDRRTAALLTDARVLSTAGCWLVEPSAREVSSRVVWNLSNRGGSR